MKISTIYWLDSEDFSGTWGSKEEIDKFSKEECLVESVGYIIKRTSKYITLAADVIDDKGEKTYGRITKIPTKMVRKIV